MIEKYQLALLELIKCSLFGSVPDLPEDTDWDAVFNEAVAQTVVALAAPAVPKEHISAWNEPVAKNTAHYMRVLYEQSNLIKLFEANGIPVAVIKGCAAAVYYPAPERRTMGDIDFLVKDEQFDTAFNLLRVNGYRFEGDFGDDRDHTFVKGGVVLELHRKYCDKSFDFQNVLSEKMDSLTKRTVCGTVFYSLPDSENGLILLDHIRHHLKGGLGIRQIIDWMMFVNEVLNSDVFEGIFKEQLSKIGLLTFCKTVTKMCKKYFGMPADVKWCDDADGSAVDELFSRVMNSGNFGRKDPYVYRPMSELTVDIKKYGLFRTLQKSGVANFPICRKHKVFRAFAWLFQAFRFAGRGISALFRGNSLTEDIKKGNENSDFYKKLGL
ncbi:MAG: nucleotidyltransferase family protein [Clostridia bacterium]|nr:nucleotidyltransferase family protein [Clostridia bacterium]